jgi:hypothetical protein
MTTDVRVVALPTNGVVFTRPIVEAVRVHRVFRVRASTTAAYLAADPTVYHQVTVWYPSNNSGGATFYVNISESAATSIDMPFAAGGDSFTYTDLAPNELSIVASSATSDILFVVCEGRPPYEDLKGRRDIA